MFKIVAEAKKINLEAVDVYIHMVTGSPKAFYVFFNDFQPQLKINPQ